MVKGELNIFGFESKSNRIPEKLSTNDLLSLGMHACWYDWYDISIEFLLAAYHSFKGNNDSLFCQTKCLLNVIRLVTNNHNEVVQGHKLNTSEYRRTFGHEISTVSMSNEKLRGESELKIYNLGHPTPTCQTASVMEKAPMELCEKKFLDTCGRSHSANYPSAINLRRSEKCYFVHHADAFKMIGPF